MKAFEVMQKEADKVLVDWSEEEFRKYRLMKLLKSGDKDIEGAIREILKKGE